MHKFNNVFLADKFDQIYCLNLSHRHDRRKTMTKQFDYLGLSSASNMDWRFSTSHPFSDISAQVFNVTRKGLFKLPNEVNCAREHYSMVKMAYDFGYSNVLIMEDDILFLKDPDIFEHTLDSIPEDWDILQFGGFVLNLKDKERKKNLENFESLRKKNPYGGWISGYKAWNCSMYALSRKGMEYYMASQEKFYTVADNPLYYASLNKNIVNAYLSIFPIVIQDWTSENPSDIRPQESNDYNSSINLYEKDIDKNNYGLF